MKKVLSIVLAMLFVMSVPIFASAETTTPDEIPADVYQQYVDETPEGYYLAEVKKIVEDEDWYRIEALYLPLVQTRAADISGTKYVDVYYSGIGVNIMRYLLSATFRVKYDGSLPECISFAHQRTYKYDNPGALTFDVTSERRELGAGYAALIVTFDAYWDGSYTQTESYRNTIACDQYGEIY